jgi:hypothetical protein
MYHALEPGDIAHAWRQGRSADRINVIVALLSKAETGGTRMHGADSVPRASLLPVDRFVPSCYLVFDAYSLQWLNGI